MIRTIDHVLDILYGLMAQLARRIEREDSTALGPWQMLDCGSRAVEWMLGWVLTIRWELGEGRTLRRLEKMLDDWSPPEEEE